MNDSFSFMSIVFGVLILVCILAGAHHLKNIDEKLFPQERATWNDTEYETNGVCAHLVANELDKCKIYFNLNN